MERQICLVQFGRRRPCEVPVRHLKAKASEETGRRLVVEVQESLETYESVRERSVSPPRPLKATKAAVALKEMLSIASPSRPKQEPEEGSWPLGNLICLAHNANEFHPGKKSKKR